MVQLVIAEMPFWPVQAITCGVIAIVLLLLGRYLYQGPHKRGTTGGRDAFMLVRGLLVLGLVVAVALQGRGFEPRSLIAAAGLIVGGILLHVKTRRSL
jgi:hypothetical protein